jgi:hypothetical protein
MLMLVDELEFGGATEQVLYVQGSLAKSSSVQVASVTTVCGVIDNAVSQRNTFRRGFKLRGMSSKSKSFVVEDPTGVCFNVPMTSISVSTLQKNWEDTPLAIALLADDFGNGTLLTQEEWQAYVQRPEVFELYTEADAGARFKIGGIYACAEANSYDYVRYIYLGKYRDVPIFCEKPLLARNRHAVPCYARITDLSTRKDAFHFIEMVSDDKDIRALQKTATALQASFSDTPAVLEVIDVDTLLSTSLLSMEAIKHDISRNSRRDGAFKMMIGSEEFEMSFSVRGVYSIADPVSRPEITCAFVAKKSVLEAMRNSLATQGAYNAKLNASKPFKAVKTTLEKISPSPSRMVVKLQGSYQEILGTLRAMLNPFVIYAEKFESVYHYLG